MLAMMPRTSRLGHNLRCSSGKLVRGEQGACFASGCRLIQAAVQLGGRAEQSRAEQSRAEQSRAEQRVKGARPAHRNQRSSS
jgi:hypothetical protein